MSGYLNSIEVYKNFITAGDKQHLVDITSTLIDEGLVCYDVYKYTPTPNENIQELKLKRKHVKIDRIDIVSRFPIIQKLSDSIKQTLNLNQFKCYYIDQTLGWMIHIMQPGASIQKHSDSYKSAAKLDWHIPQVYSTLRHIRFNIMVDRDDHNSYNPHFVMNNKELSKYVAVGDAWCFPADNIVHYVPNLIGSKQRVIYQFGFAIDTTSKV